MRPTLLLCNIPERKMGALRLCAVQLGLHLVAVPPERQGLTAEEVLSGVQEAKAPQAPFTEELLMLCGLPDRTVDGLLARLRRQRATIALKAVLTPTNREWPLDRLYGELCRERQAFAEGGTAHGESAT